MSLDLLFVMSLKPDMDHEDGICIRLLQGYEGCSSALWSTCMLLIILFGDDLREAKLVSANEN